MSNNIFFLSSLQEFACPFHRYIFKPDFTNITTKTLIEEIDKFKEKVIAETKCKAPRCRYWDQCEDDPRFGICRLL